MNDFQAGDAVIVAGIYFEQDGARPYLSRATVLLPADKIVRFSYGTARELCSAESVHRTQGEAVAALEALILQHAKRLEEQSRNVLATATIL